MNKIVRLFSIIVLTLAVALPLYAGEQKTTDSTKAVVDSTVTNSDKIIVYYFYSTRRCPSCLKIENYTKTTVETKFAEQLKSGEIEWQMVNTDLDENKHFYKDYRLYTKSVVLSQIEQDKEIKFKNLEKVWELLGDEKEFAAYIEKEIIEFSLVE